MAVGRGEGVMVGVRDGNGVELEVSVTVGRGEGMMVGVGDENGVEMEVTGRFVAGTQAARRRKTIRVAHKKFFIFTFYSEISKF